MTMQFPRNLHAEGWLNHMPPGHRIDIVMNPGELPASRHDIAPGPASRASTQPNAVVISEPIVQTGPTVRTPPRRIKRSHASAWILVAAVGATGGALAVANMRDPQSMREHLDATLDEVKSLTSSSSTSTTMTAQATAPTTAPASTPVQEAGPVIAAKSTVPAKISSPDAPLPRISPAAGRSVSSTLPVTPIEHLAPLEPSMTNELPDTQQVVPSLPPPAQPAPVQLPAVIQAQPMVQAPPAVVAPLIVQPPQEVAPPPVQTSASSPQR